LQGTDEEIDPRAPLAPHPAVPGSAASFSFHGQSLDLTLLQTAWFLLHVREPWGSAGFSLQLAERKRAHKEGDWISPNGG
jgi:hypothetical protein